MPVCIRSIKYICNKISGTAINMMDKYIKQFDRKLEIREAIDNALAKLDAVLKMYPFHTDPTSIDSLTPEDLFNPKNKPNYFFYWVEHGLKDLGSIGVGSTAPWRNACKNIIIFKQILHELFRPGLSIAERVDLPWDKIKMFGADRQIAKKIISMYFDDVIPIFNTDHLVNIHRKLIGSDLLPQGFRKMSVGEKYQYLMEDIMRLKQQNEITKIWNNAYFMRFLYTFYPPWIKKVQQTPISEERLRRFGLLQAPDTEQEVVFLFSKLHEKLGFPTIIKIQTKFPDVQALDSKRNVAKIELEISASNFLEHNHPPSGCDYVICWENDLGDQWPHPKVKVLQLRDYL